MDESTRIAWASADARDVWQPRMQAVSTAWLDVELASVREGLRPAALVFGAARVRASGLPAMQVAPDRFAVGPFAATLAHAYAHHDDAMIGELLGFPICCRAFFDRVWNVDGKRDPTLAMAGDVNGPGESILGRWLGVRSVPHLPCSWQCRETATIANQWRSLWPTQARRWADEVLSWPVQYSALHGVAILTFPIVKLVTRTDYTATNQTLQRHGTRYPDEAPSGIGFPFRRRPAVIALQSRAREWTANGFTSRAAMDDAHAMVLAAINGRPVSSVIDLGCGNGRLLDRIPAALKVGIEADGARAGTHAAVRVGRIQDVATLVPETVDLAIIARRRFAEMTPGDAAGVRAWLRTHAGAVLEYSYDSPQFAEVQS